MFLLSEGAEGKASLLHRPLGARNDQVIPRGQLEVSRDISGTPPGSRTDCLEFGEELPSLVGGLQLKVLVKEKKRCHEFLYRAFL